MSLLTSVSIEGTNSGRNRRCPCLTGREPFFTAKWDTYSTSSSEVKRARTYADHRSSVVPRLISFSSSTVALTCSSIPGGASIESSGWDAIGSLPPTTVDMESDVGLGHLPGLF
ncbi:hypothetical protein LIER_32495 [Lithospermum erythrorhizon]|uniref:Uncharacterized protein n=1 Tax=Lithospermum erythrorhizon TaxID=34254 RepID=A0AAV3RY18_LITER